MQLNVEQVSLTDISADAVVVNLFEGVKRPGGGTGAVDRALDGLITQTIASGELKGKLNEVALLHTGGKLPCAKVLVVGLGEAEKFDPQRVRQASGTAARFLNEKGCRRVASILHGGGVGGIEPSLAARALAEGTLIGLHQLDAYKTKDRKQTLLQELVVADLGADKIPAIRAGLERGRKGAEATNLARDLVNEPPNVMTPTALVERARAVAEQYGLGFEALEKEDLEHLGMGGMLSVSSGSAQPPKLILMRHQAGDGPPLALVGKGVTFDSGGVSLKPANAMEDMKVDMAGAAAVIGAMKAICECGAKGNVLGVVPAVENMPGGNAAKVGDVIRCFNGKTVEITSTDAEGRLILADAMGYAQRQGATRMVDFATLTGSCIVALGNTTSGIMGNERQWVEGIVAAGEEAGERMWQFPLFPEYEELIESAIADMKQGGGREAGAIQGGMFLKQFVEDGAAWAHVDIAGTVLLAKDRPYQLKGATGVGVRTMLNLVLAQGESAQR